MGGGISKESGSVVEAGDGGSEGGGGVAYVRKRGTTISVVGDLEGGESGGGDLGGGVSGGGDGEEGTAISGRL